MGMGKVERMRWCKVGMVRREVNSIKGIMEG
jgi:hypothetical protein